MLEREVFFGQFSICFDTKLKSGLNIPGDLNQ